MSNNPKENISYFVSDQLCGLNSLYIAISFIGKEPPLIDKLIADFPGCARDGVSLNDIASYCEVNGIHVKRLTINDNDIVGLPSDCVVLSLINEDSAPHVILKKTSKSGKLICIDFDRKLIDLNANDTTSHASLVMSKKYYFTPIASFEMQLGLVVLLVCIVSFLLCKNKTIVRLFKG